MGNQLSALDAPLAARRAAAPADGAAPAAREAAAAVALGGGRMLVFGGGAAAAGESGGEAEAVQLDDLWVLHVADGRWERRTATGDAPSARAAAAVAVAGDSVVLFGGCSAAEGYLADTYVLDTKIWRWERVRAADGGSNAPAARDKAALVPNAGGTHVVLLGGFGPREEEEEEADEEDDLPHDDEWDGDSDGEGNQGPSTSFGWFGFETLHIFDVRERRWKVKEAAGDRRPTARAAHAACAVRGGTEAVLFGGRDESGRQGDCWSLSGLEHMTKLEWTPRCEGKAAPAPRSFHAAAAVPMPAASTSGAAPESAVFVLGGLGREGETFKGLDVLSTATWEWRTCAPPEGPFPADRASCSVAAVGSQLVAFGGSVVLEEGASASAESFAVDVGASVQALAAAPPATQAA